MSENAQNGISLLKKGRRGLFRILFSKMGITVLLLLLSVSLLFSVFYWFERFLPHIFGGTALFSAVMVLCVINSRLDPTAKITWLTLIMLLPVFGGLLYLFTQREWGHRLMRQRLDVVIQETKKQIQKDDAISQMYATDAGAAAMCRYVGGTGCFPVYQNTEVTYFPFGEDKFSALLTQLESAKQSIFMEYFIIEEGHMWGKILQVLARKAREGVDVRVMYDGTCEFMLLPKGYAKKLEALGIACKVFSRVTPIVSLHYNFRDHRKITVIDGNTAFTGGVNLADEYINRKVVFGQWKDTAVMLRGDAAQSLQMLFLQMWNLDRRHAQWASAPVHEAYPEAAGFVMPYGDSPLDGQKVGKRIYMDILNRAERYVHIMTPYLILDEELQNAIQYAALRGVEVALILPGIPDKLLPYALAKSHYAALLEAGVQIYEYTPGFVHAKEMICDDKEAVVGTINMDYRSLYHHFECAVYLHSVPAISDMENDFLSTKEACRRVTPDTVKQEKWYIKLLGVLLKVIAPLL